MEILTVVMALATSMISGVAGFGGAMIFLPILVAAHGVRASVPILTICIFMANASRVYFYRRDLRFHLAGLFWAGALPSAILGSLVYVSISGFWIKKFIGVFLIFTVLYQKLARPVRIQNAKAFVPLGVVSGFISAVVGGTGPLTAPFFLAYGLTKEAFVGTESLCAMGMHFVKILSYGKLGVLGPQEFRLGLFYGVIMSLGSYLATKILTRISRESFRVMVEWLLVAVGIMMLVR